MHNEKEIIICKQHNPIPWKVKIQIKKSRINDDIQ